MDLSEIILLLILGVLISSGVLASGVFVYQIYKHNCKEKNTTLIDVLEMENWMENDKN